MLPSTMSSLELPWVVIGTRGSDHVRIELIDHEPDDWFRTRVKVACGVWSGIFRWDFHKGELQQFAEQVGELYKTLSGSARLMPLEPNVELEMTGNGKGHVFVSGRARAEFDSGTHVVFRFEVDQTQLPIIRQSLLLIDP